jgi:hypothetical protein
VKAQTNITVSSFTISTLAPFCRRAWRFESYCLRCSVLPSVTLLSPHPRNPLFLYFCSRSTPSFYRATSTPFSPTSPLLHSIYTTPLYVPVRRRAFGDLYSNIFGDGFGRSYLRLRRVVIYLLLFTCKLLGTRPSPFPTVCPSLLSFFPIQIPPPPVDDSFPALTTFFFPLSPIVSRYPFASHHIPASVVN